MEAAPNTEPTPVATTISKTQVTVTQYAEKLYDAMIERSEPIDEYHIYHGKVTELFNELKIPMTYYSRIRRLLVMNGSIEMIKRGSRGLASDVLLRHPPSELPSPGTGSAIVKIASDRLTNPAPPATLIAEFERRLARLEAWRETTGRVNITDTLRNHESRLSHLESEPQESQN
jgi:hypothetical protein